MGDSTFKPKINNTGAQDPVISKANLDFMRAIEQKNLERVQKLNLMRKRNRITASVIGAGVVSIYLYSMFAVKQETFLDDFNEPQKVLQE